MNAGEVTDCFNALFGDQSRTVLAGGVEEPFYEAAREPGGIHRIYFCQDYVSSALHEIAHWCIAGRRRRRLDDYGYWYLDRRNPDQQRAFEQVEARPQALEWILSIAAGVAFRVSCDNLEQGALEQGWFRLQIRRQVHELLSSGLPARAGRIAGEFAAYTGVSDFLSACHYEELPR